MSSKLHDTQGQEVWQEVDPSDEDWNELVASRLPADLESKAIELSAWSRQREVRSIRDLLRALLVLAALGFSFQRLAMWATRHAGSRICPKVHGASDCSGQLSG